MLHIVTTFRSVIRFINVRNEETQTYEALIGTYIYIHVYMVKISRLIEVLTNRCYVKQFSNDHMTNVFLGKAVLALV